MAALLLPKGTGPEKTNVTEHAASSLGTESTGANRKVASVLKTLLQCKISAYFSSCYINFTIPYNQPRRAGYGSNMTTMDCMLNCNRGATGLPCISSYLTAGPLRPKPLAMAATPPGSMRGYRANLCSTASLPCSPTVNGHTSQSRAS